MAKTEKQNKKKIKELIELNDELENYFSNTIIPQLFVDANLILRKYTPPAMKHFKFTPDHIGKPMEELVDNIRYSTIMENIQEVIDSKEILEKEIQTTDSRWFQMNIVPYIIKKDNQPNGVIITFVDITDRIKNLREIEKLNSSHETFIYSVSHDLKAPLANIEGLIKELIGASEGLINKKSNASQDQKEIAKMLEKAVKSMRTIINELSEITKIEGNYKETVECVKFENVLEEVQLTLKDKISESKAQIKLDIQEPDIEFSRKNLRSILYNLLSNALKYHSPDRIPKILIKTEKIKNHIQISVKDNGLGIPENKITLVFTPYTRFEKDVEGTGIGLHLVKKIVENNGGKITVKSKLGKGSEFIVILKAS